MAVFVLSAILALQGCSVGERRRVSRESNALATGFVDQMDKGQTTRDQEQRFIRAMNKVLLELDRSIRGTKKAEETREDAIRAVNGPLRLD